MNILQKKIAQHKQKQYDNIIGLSVCVVVLTMWIVILFFI